MQLEIVVERSGDLPIGIEEAVRESEAEGFGFVRTLCDEWRSGANRFDAPGEAFLVARVGTELAGVCGLNRDPFEPGGRSVGRLRRLWVRPRFRRLGVATTLTRVALSLASGRFASVRLRTTDPGASAFYEALGFASIKSKHATHRVEAQHARLDKALQS